MNRRWSRVAAIVVILLLCPAALATAQPPVGTPIAADPGAASEVVPGTWRLAPMRAADPDRGPAWGLAVFDAHQPQAPRTIHRIVCLAVGRVLGGSLGAIDAAGVYHPFEPGVGTIACGGQAGAHDRLALYVQRFLLSIGNERSCLPGRAEARLFRTPLCDGRRVRTVFAGALGEGIRSVVLERRGAAPTRLPLGPEASFLAVLPGTFSDANAPDFHVTATLCGPHARPDLRTSYGARRHGCTLTLDLPGSPRPQPESVASRRARRARALAVPLTVVDHPGTASRRRFVVRLRAPITIERATEGYAYRLLGPGGPACRDRVAVTTERSALSSYLTVAGRPLSLPLLPPDGPLASWCPGRYTLTVVFSASRLVRGAHDPAPHRVYDVKQIGRTTFRIR